MEMDDEFRVLSLEFRVWDLCCAMCDLEFGVRDGGCELLVTRCVLCDDLPICQFANLSIFLALLNFLFLMTYTFIASNLNEYPLMPDVSFSTDYIARSC